MLNFILHGYNLNQAKRLMGDIPDDRICEQPRGVINHPAWQLGHLAYTSERAGVILGLSTTLPQDWEALFAPGSKPTSDAAAYPSKATLLQALEEQHGRVAEAIGKTDLSVLQQPTPRESTRKIFPTVGDLVIFLLTGHEAWHLGQLMAWRRAAGLGAAN